MVDHTCGCLHRGSSTAAGVTFISHGNAVLCPAILPLWPITLKSVFLKLPLFVLQTSPPLKVWCTHSILARFLQARDWNVTQAEKQLRGTLEWSVTLLQAQLQLIDGWVQNLAQSSACNVFQQKVLASLPSRFYLFTHRRKTYRPDAIAWAEIEPEAVTGKQFRLGMKDKDGRAVLVMRPRSVGPPLK